jgi:alpha-2-macroglobulin
MQRIALLFLFLFAAPLAALQGDGADLLRRAEALYARGSFEEARALYEQADALPLDEPAARFVDFRLADAGWRSAAQSQNPDTSRLDAAREQLEALLATYKDEAERDELWAELHASLGDFHWGREQSSDWGSGWQHYAQALDWWAGSRELDKARGRYLGIVRRALEPKWWGERSWDSYGYRLDLTVLKQAASIAVEPEDKGWTGFFLGRAYYQGGSTALEQTLARKTLEDVLALGRGNAWYDDALYQLGVFLEERGDLVQRADGGEEWRPDYAGAVARYKQLRSELKKGETRYHDEAGERIRRITAPELSVGVDRFFVPGSEVQYHLRWRNVKEVELALYPVDLTRDVERDAGGEDRSPSDFVGRLRLAGGAPAVRWTYATGDEGEHRPGHQALVVKDPPAAGAYVLVARGGGEESRELVLVSDVVLSAKAVGGKVLGWLTDLESGKPIQEARVFLWERWHDGSWHQRTAEGVTGADGTVLFERKDGPGSSDFCLAAALGARQAFATGNGYSPYSAEGNWQVYAFADRPAYRPADEVQWKVLARTQTPGGYATPAGDALRYQILDPRGEVAGEGDVTLNAFGAAWGSFKTTSAHALGAYQLQLLRNGSHVASAPLFRLEEYKLPEYEVSVSLPEDPARPGAKKLFRLGDRVEAVVQAEYYFGGPVAGAQVEVLVYQRPYYHSWPVPYEYPWYYAEGLVYRGWWGGPGQLVSRATYTSDAQGRVMVPIDTTLGSSSDLEYTLEARVVDASRREVVSQETLRVTRQAYFVRVAPAHALHRPGDRVELAFDAQDANLNPVAAEGEVVVTRDTWVERWRSPKGEELQGSALESLRKRAGIFPPPAEPGWVLVFNGYEREEVARARVATGADGKAEWSFQAAREGYYSVVWTSTDDRGQRIQGTAAFWVAEERTNELGYRQGGVEILVDKDTFEAGERAAVMLSVPASDRWVLFTVEGDELHHFEVVHVTGTVKLLYLELGDEHVPNVYLGALMVSGRQTWWDQKEVVVPPVKSFLDVAVAPDSPTYEPGEKGTLTVTVRDHAGKPVQGEIALAVYDASLGYIQEDQAGDPRQRFYGERDPQLVRTTTTLNHRSFGKLVTKDGEVVDERAAWNQAGGKEEHDGFEGKLGRDDMRSELALAKSAMAPAMAAEGRGQMMDSASREVAGITGGFRGPSDTAPPDLGAVQVRTDFRDTAVWVAAVVADGDGTAVIEVPYPDSTTRWTAVARVADTGARFGIGQTETRTRQPLIARLQAPRFLQVGDEVTLSGNLNNNTDEPLTVHALLEVEGVELLGRRVGEELADPATGPLSVPANGEVRVDWLVRVTRPGEAVLRLKAASPEHQDGMERRLPVHPHGIDALVARSGKLTADELRLTLELPAARAAGSTTLTVELTPSLAVTMLDALPYLVQYPYGCTEQTLSRFVPAAVVAGTLKEFGLSAEEAMARVFGGVERETAGETHKPSAGLEQLDDAVAQGLARLYDFQHGDGGWAWWKDGDSDHWMTAYVVWGLTVAQEAGVDVRADVLDRGRRFLELELVERELDVDVQAWMLFALAWRLAHAEAESAEAERAFQNLWEKRAGLNAYTRALFALAAKDLGHMEEARTLVENLANGVIRDDAPDTSVVMTGAQAGRDDALKTAHWGEDGVWSRWSEGGVEATAFALSALVAIEPKHALVQPAVNWLVQNRRAGQWSNTRDTAMVVLALGDYIKASGELASDVAYELFVNGKSIAKQQLAKSELLAAPSRFAIDAALLRDGPNEVRVVRSQGGPLYFAAHARFFSQEEPIPARGNVLFVRREHYRLKPVPTLLKGVLYEKEKLADGAVVKSGDRIEVLLTAEAKNHLEYLLFEDLKPAGFEAVQVQSGAFMVARELKSSEVERRFVDGGRREELLIPGSGSGAYSWRSEEGYTGRSVNLHQELRDRHVALFADRLPQGVWEMRYELRAETPGSFHALPTLAHAMYVPEIRGNSDELRVEVVDEGAP